MAPETIIDPATGAAFTVVEPGSAEDPFTDPAKAGSSVRAVAEPQAAEPEARSVGRPAPQPVTAAKPETPPAQPAPVAASARGKAEEPTAEELEDANAELQRLVDERVESAKRQLQSSSDKRVDAVQKRLDELVEQNKQLQKQMKEASISELPEDEREKILAKWALDERKADLDVYADELEGMFKETYIALKADEYSDYGVTPELLARFDEPEDIDAQIEAIVAGYDRALAAAGLSKDDVRLVPGSTLRTLRSGVVEPAPAGASAASDVGGEGAATPPAKFDQGKGVESLARNLNTLPWVNVRI